MNCRSIGCRDGSMHWSYCRSYCKIAVFESTHCTGSLTAEFDVADNRHGLFSALWVNCLCDIPYLLSLVEIFWSCCRSDFLQFWLHSTDLVKCTVQFVLVWSLSTVSSSHLQDAHWRTGSHWIIAICEPSKQSVDVESSRWQLPSLRKFCVHGLQ